MRIRITNQAEFSRKLKQFAERAGIAPGLVAQRVALEAFEGVVERTPVRTGWARASWNLAEGTIDPSVPPKPAEGAKLPPPVPVEPSTGKDFPVFYVTNNLDYIEFLEQGKSIQMDKGYMIQRTLAALAADIDTILREIDV